MSPPEKVVKVIADEGEPVSDITSISSRLARSKINAKKKKNQRFSCDGGKGNQQLSETKELNAKVHRYTSLTGDEKLLIKLVKGS